MPDAIGRLDAAAWDVRTEALATVAHVESPVARSDSDVLFPEMRRDVQYAISALADEGYQRAVWIEHRLPQDHLYDVEMACHAVLDDVDVLGDGPALVGTVLRNDAELAAVEEVAKRLIAVIGDVGPMADYRTSCESPSWPSVVAAARRAVMVLGLLPEPMILSAARSEG